MKSAPVTEIQKAAKGRIEPRNPLLRELLQIAVPPLRQCLRALFDNTDDALFELADKSETDAQQALYFDAMRHIRLHRESVCEKFFKDLPIAYFVSFEAKQAPGQAAAGTLETDSDIPDLALVNSDELEINVAIAGMVSKITSRFSLPLANLTRRIGTLHPAKTMIERDNPLAPHKLSEVFAASIEHLNLDIRVRIILLKLLSALCWSVLGPPTRPLISI